MQLKKMNAEAAVCPRSPLVVFLEVPVKASLTLCCLQGLSLPPHLPGKTSAPSLGPSLRFLPLPLQGCFRIKQLEEEEEEERASTPYTGSHRGGHHCRCSSAAAQALSNSFQLSLRDSLGIFPPVESLCRNSRTVD